MEGGPGEARTTSSTISAHHASPAAALHWPPTRSVAPPLTGTPFAIRGTHWIWASRRHRCWLAHIGMDEGQRGRSRCSSCLAHCSTGLNMARGGVARHQIHVDVSYEWINRWTSMSGGWWLWCCSLLLSGKRKEEGERDRENRETKGEGRRRGRSTGRAALTPSPDGRPWRRGGSTRFSSCGCSSPTPTGSMAPPPAGPPLALPSLATDGTCGSSADKI